LRLKNQSLSVIGDPFNRIVLLGPILLFCLIVAPLLTMVGATCTAAKAELRNIPGAGIADFALPESGLTRRKNPRKTPNLHACPISGPRW